jgi:hypothetical protein
LAKHGAFITDPAMDSIKLNCYDLHILMILCSQLVTNGVRKKFGVFFVDTRYSTTPQHTTTTHTGNTKNTNTMISPACRLSAASIL